MGTPEIFRSIRNYSVLRVIRYIEGGGDVNLKDDDGNSLLMIATSASAYNIAKILVNAGADIMSANNNNETIFDIKKDDKSNKRINFLSAMNETLILSNFYNEPASKTELIKSEIGYRTLTTFDERGTGPVYFKTRFMHSLQDTEYRGYYYGKDITVHIVSVFNGSVYCGGGMNIECCYELTKLQSDKIEELIYDYEKKYFKRMPPFTNLLNTLGEPACCITTHEEEKLNSSD